MENGVIAAISSADNMQWFPHFVSVYKLTQKLTGK